MSWRSIICIMEHGCVRHCLSYIKSITNEGDRTVLMSLGPKFPSQNRVEYPKVDAGRTHNRDEHASVHLDTVPKQKTLHGQNISTKNLYLIPGRFSDKKLHMKNIWISTYEALCRPISVAYPIFVLMVTNRRRSTHNVHEWRQTV